MFSGYYTAASGMLTQQRTINVLANNLMNAETPGFRSERVVTTTFEQAMVKRIENGNSAVIGSSSPVRTIEQLVSDFGSGILEITEKPCDIAIDGEGYFVIEGTDGLYLTRNGGFQLDSEGYLELSGIGRVLGERGAVHIGNAQFTVLPDGGIYDGEGNFINRVTIAAPLDMAALQRTDNGLYTAAAGFDPGDVPPPEDTVLVQYAIEKSNVDFNRELSIIMEAQRSFQACSTILKGLDEINQKSANQIASI